IREPSAGSTYGVRRWRNARPASASSMRKSRCVPKYGAGLGLRTVAWISCRSSAGACAKGSPLSDSLMDAMFASLFGGPHPFPIFGPQVNDQSLRLSNLVEEFLKRLAGALEFSSLRYRQIGMGDVPAFCRDLVLVDPVFHLRAANPRPAFAGGEDDIHLV